MQLSDAQAAAEKEAGARGLVQKIEAKLKSRKVAEGDPASAITGSSSEAELLASLQQLGGMLAPPLGGMLKKLLAHWEATGGAAAAATDRSKQLQAENAELRSRCEALAAAAATVASAAADLGGTPAAGAAAADEGV